MSHKNHYLLIILLGVSTGIQAQESTYSLEQCIEYAQKNNSSIHQSQANEQISTANYKDAIGALLPNISASTNVHINYGRGIDPKTNTYTNVNSFRNNYSIESSLLLFDGLSSIYNLKSQRNEQLATHEEAKKTARDIKMSTIEAYYNLLYTKELKRLAESHLANSQQLVKQAERMFELGMKAPADVAEAKATLAKDKQMKVQQSNQYEIALLQLKAVMNYPIEQPLVITDSLTYGDVEPSLLKPEDLYSSALKGLPEALISEHRLKSSKDLYKSSIGAFAPRVNLFAGFNTGFSYYMDGSPHESFNEQLRNRRGGYVGVSLTIDLFTGLRKTNQLRRSKAQYFVQQMKSQEVKRDIYKNIQEAILNLNASVEEYKTAVETAEHLKQVYDASLKNYQVGHSSSIDLSISSARYKESVGEVAHKYTMYLLRKESLAYYSAIIQ